MRPDIESATQRVVAVRARLAGMPDDDALVNEIEDALCQGYVEALAGDAWVTHTELRLQELIDDDSIVDRGRELRLVAREHGAAQHSLITLRRELAALRRLRDRSSSRSVSG